MRPSFLLKIRFDFYSMETCSLERMEEIMRHHELHPVDRRELSPGPDPMVYQLFRKARDFVDDILPAAVNSDEFCIFRE